MHALYVFGGSDMKSWEQSGGMDRDPMLCTCDSHSNWRKHQKEKLVEGIEIGHEEVTEGATQRQTGPLGFGDFMQGL
jgi:hypothetical protein